MDQDLKFNNLCSHYKDVCDVHRESIKQRNKLFYRLLSVFALFAVQSSASKLVASIVCAYLKISDAQLQSGGEASIIPTLLWFALLGFSMRYFQIQVEIEKQYEYLHALENDINSFYTGSAAFTKEGKAYLNEYPLFSNWICFLYTMVFPVLLLLTAGTQIYNEIKATTPNWSVDSLCCAIIIISTILYFFKIHGEPKALKGIRALLKDL